MERLQELVIEVEGMTCGNCEEHVTRALLEVPGVKNASASLKERRAVITADGAVATVELLRAAIANAGYEAGEIIQAE